MGEDGAVLEEGLDEHGLHFEPVFVGRVGEGTACFEVFLQARAQEGDELLEKRDALVEVPLSV